MLVDVISVCYAHFSNNLIRTDFPCLPDSILCSDTGWGCTVRSTQMLIARAFVEMSAGTGNLDC